MPIASRRRSIGGRAAGELVHGRPGVGLVQRVVSPREVLAAQHERDQEKGRGGHLQDLDPGQGMGATPGGGVERSGQQPGHQPREERTPGVRPRGHDPEHVEQDRRGDHHQREVTNDPGNAVVLEPQVHAEQLLQSEPREEPARPAPARLAAQLVDRAGRECKQGRRREQDAREGCRHADARGRIRVLQIEGLQVVPRRVRLDESQRRKRSDTGAKADDEQPHIRAARQMVDSGAHCSWDPMTNPTIGAVPDSLHLFVRQGRQKGAANALSPFGLDFSVPLPFRGRCA